MTAAPRWLAWEPARGQAERASGELSSSAGAYRGSGLRVFARRLGRQPTGLASLIVLVLIVLAALFAPFIAPDDPNAQRLSLGLNGPSADHLLGTDNLGRDILSRLLFASRVSLIAACQALAVAFVLGVPFGFLAGYARGPVDAVISLVNDAVMALPPLLLAVGLVGALGRGLGNAMIAVGVVLAPRFLRLVRGVVLSLRERPFIEASVTCGTSAPRVVLRHLLPNALSPILVQTAFIAGYAILAEASLSFLGLGVQLPHASWGSMLNRAFLDLQRSIWQLVPPAVAIAVTVLALNLLGDAIRNAIGREVDER
jgi:ABC-type dipeptide/oligopeptide/nickel transport system permease subunit